MREISHCKNKYKKIIKKMKKFFFLVLLGFSVSIMTSCEEHEMSICSATKSGDLYRAEITYVGDELSGKETEMFLARLNFLMYEDDLTTDELRQELEWYVDKAFDKDVRMHLYRKVGGDCIRESTSRNFWISPGGIVLEFVLGSVIFLAFCSFLGHWRRHKG